MSKCRNHILAWVFSFKFAAYFQNTFSKEHLWWAASAYQTLKGIQVSCVLYSYRFTVKKENCNKKNWKQSAFTEITGKKVT